MDKINHCVLDIDVLMETPPCSYYLGINKYIIAKDRIINIVSKDNLLNKEEKKQLLDIINNSYTSLERLYEIFKSLDINYRCTNDTITNALLWKNNYISHISIDALIYIAIILFK